MTGRDEPLVGRAKELAALDDALTAVHEERRFRAVQLTGDPGIGKSRLLRELVERADGRGMLVLSGRASELESELPFWLFVDALDEYLRALEPRRFDALDDDARGELARVLPSLRSLATADGTIPQDERFRTHRAFRKLLELLAGAKGLVLALDDLHWSDSGSMDLLGSLLRRPPAAPVLIVIAMRPAPVDARLVGALERAERGGVLARVGLGALSLDESRALLGAAIGEATAVALHEESGGNPFYLQQLARGRDGRAPARRAVGDVLMAGVAIPSAVADALTDELAVLDSEARRVLEGAAVAGDPFEPELAAAAAALPESVVVSRLDELLRRDLVRPTEIPRRFRFRHPLVRRAVYEASPGGWRLGAHERSAAALAARGASPVARAHHVDYAARHGDATAIAVLRDAGDAVVQRTPAGAARWYSAALRLLAADAAAVERIGLLGSLSRALAATGRFADAHAALLDAIALVPETAAPLRVELELACAGVEQLLGRLADGQARLEALLDDLGADGSAEVAAAHVELTAVAIARLSFEQARRYGARALELARGTGDPGLIAAAAATLAFGAASNGGVSEAERHRAEAAALIDAMPDDELARRLGAIRELARAELYLDRFAEAAAHAERGIAVTRATGQAQLFPVLVPLVGWLRGMSGRLDESAALLDGAIEAARVAGNAQALAWSLFNRAMTALHAGDVDAALLLAQESADLTREPGGSLLGCFAGLILGTTLVEYGAADEGVSLMIERGGGAELRRVGDCGWRAYFLEWLGRGLLAAGRPGEAARAAAVAEQVAASTGLRLAAASAGRLAARVALSAGEPASAARQALAAAAAADEVGALIEAALSRFVAGRAFGQAGAHERATVELSVAATAFDAIGAVRYRAQVERELGRLGHRTHRRTRRAGAPGLESLTERELEVARLIVERKTNPQIAEALFLSQKTVETHVRHLFEKLGVSSRVEIARTLERAERRSG